ncbi:MAG TPA: hypothetical protein EYH53_04900 [Methanothermococcus okinawensis]|nr:hypothetical protein [Methanothermococcus okinawensis]
MITTTIKKLKRLFKEFLETIKKYFFWIIDTIDRAIYFKLNIGRARGYIKRKKISLGDIKKLIDKYRDIDEDIMKFYDIQEYIDYDRMLERKRLEEIEIDLDELLERSYMNILKDYITNFSYCVIRSKYLPSLRDFQYIGIKDINKYFMKVIVISIVVGLIYFLNFIDNIFIGLLNGLFATILVMVAGIYYPKIKLILFRGDIKIQIMVTLLDMIASLNAGMSLQECIKKIAENPEYGIPSFEFKGIIYDIEKGGYSFKEALERARFRTKILLMKKLYTQLIVAIDKGGTQLLLKSLYNDILRESMAKIDSSKFQITNLGNLIFGVGIILPFAGMMLSAIQGNTGFSGIINTVDLILTKIAPISAAIFAVFIKLKIE